MIIIVYLGLKSRQLLYLWVDVYIQITDNLVIIVCWERIHLFFYIIFSVLEILLLS